MLCLHAVFSSVGDGVTLTGLAPPADFALEVWRW
jgi:hypothetical protein